VYFSHYYLQHNSKTNDPKVFKLGVGNDLGFGVERSKVMLGTVINNTTWVAS